jgi:serpin B
MLVILPEPDTDLNYWLTDMSNEKLHFLINNLNSQRLEVSLPRFKIEFKRELNSDLVKLGMTDAFLPAADFSRISRNTDLLIDIVMHRGFIEVDETGSEAAAATAVAMKMLSAGPPPTPVPFNADHPFIFLLMEDSMNLVLFAGIVNNPADK